MCQSATECVPRTHRWIAWVFALSAFSLQAQVTGWRQIGGTSVDVALVSPTTGPVERVWFSANGLELYARSASGTVFVSRDFENWTRTTAQPPADEAAPAVQRTPSHQVGLRRDPMNRGRLYALGANIFRSDDGGRNWANVTGAGDTSVIGPNQRDLAISPLDSDILVVANDFGLWRSVDAGLTWIGLNDSLPNLSVRRILSLPNGATGLRIWNPQFGPLERHPGSGNSWQPAEDEALRQELESRHALSAQFQTLVSALAIGRNRQYAGSHDGRMWTSTDDGRTWTDSATRWNAPVESIAVDTEDSRIAIAVLGSMRGARVLRTVNGGLFWDDITSNLPDGAAHGAAFDRAARTVYIATGRGVFLSRVDLDGAGPAGSWSAVEGLPQSVALDVRLDTVRHQLFVGFDGPGVFAGPAPHRGNSIRWVNAADLSNRPAAPGSLLSLFGANVRSARAGSLQVPLLASSEGEAQVQIPFEASGDRLSMALETPGRTVSLGIPMLRVSPAIFIDPDGSPMLLDAETGVLLDASNPARAGSRVQVLATGLGRVNPEWPTGLAAPLENPPKVRANVSAFLDQTPVRVTASTLAPGYIGFYLIEIELPAVVQSGPAELFLRTDDRESNRVRVYLTQ